MFEKLDTHLDNRENKLAVQIKNGISKHLSTLKSEFERYFPKITYDELHFIRNPFTFSIEKFFDQCQDKFLELVNVSLARQTYHENFSHSFGLK